MADSWTERKVAELEKRLAAVEAALAAHAEPAKQTGPRKA